MGKYLAYDGIDGEFENFENIEGARNYLTEGFLSEDEGYHPEMTTCKIYGLIEKVLYKKIDSRENYKYDYEDEAPEGEEDLVWPYENAFDEVGEHEFSPVPTEREEQICQLIEKLQKCYIEDAKCAKYYGTGKVYEKEFEDKAKGLGLAIEIVKKHCGIK
ncbi:MAG: hypothetical protein ACLFQE_07035 [Thermotogota bacterium]